MATKTISIELDVYEKLKEARAYPSESFSKVLRRIKFNNAGTSGEQLLAKFKGRRNQREFFSSEILDTLEIVQRKDRPPKDKWHIS